MNWKIGWIGFTALRHILGHFERGQPWASLLSSLPVLSAHCFASNWQLFSWISGRERMVLEFFFVTTSQRKNVLPSVGIELSIVRITGRLACDWSTVTGWTERKRQIRALTCCVSCREWIWFIFCLSEILMRGKAIVLISSGQFLDAAKCFWTPKSLCPLWLL